jgi:ribosomal protein S12 methylthiotransferase accessory factor
MAPYSRFSLRNDFPARPLGSIPVDQLIAKLEQLGISVGDDGALRIVLTDDYLHQELPELAAEESRIGRPWLLVKPTGRVIWLGPLIDPVAQGCWHCLAARLQSQPRSSPLPALMSTVETALSLTSYAVLGWLHQADETESLTDRLVTIDMVSMQSQTHALVRRATCSHCSPASDTCSPALIVLTSRERAWSSDGGYRAALPEQTWQAIEHHVSPLTGIVPALKRRLADRQGLINVYVTGANPESQQAKWLHRRCAGKGMSDLQARLGAVCESLERYSGRFEGNEVRLQASYSELGSAAIHPNSCMLFSERQYQDRQQWNRVEGTCNWVPEQFDEEQQVEWSAAWSLTTGTCRYLPTALCFYDYNRQQRISFCRPDSNGNAAGTTIEEAILQGFFELVERDAVALWWYNRINRPGLSLQSFDQPYVQALCDHYRCHGRDLWMLDLTTDLAIPTFVAVSCNHDRGRIALGFGAHLEAGIAVTRALTEMNQLLDTPFTVPQEATLLLAGPAGSSYLMPDEAVRPRQQSDYQQVHELDLKEHVERCVRIAADHDLETIVVDQTRAEVGLTVVKVIVPGLRPFWARFAPGRLYQVPVHIGWRRQAATESELNQVHLAL